MADAVRFWRRGIWLSLIALLLAALSLAPYLRSSTELVRMRHALVLVDGVGDSVDWTPAKVPADYLLERTAPYPEFADAVSRLRLEAMASDWERALAISRHLLGSSPELSGGAIQSDLRDTYQRIINKGEGYCGDFVRTFTGLAIAAGIPVRAWAFSFDGFGGHGHIWPEIWNRQLGRWQLLDVFDNLYVVGADAVPLSALEFRRAMREDSASLRLLPLHPGARPGFVIEDKAWDYFGRGIDQWYMVFGNNVFSYDRALLVRTFGSLSRSLEQFGGIAQGVYPGVRILADEANREQVVAMQRLRWHLFLVAGIALAALLGLLLSLLAWRRARARLAQPGRR
ncbi:MAG: transglutaminase [Candidatus Accumulibacter phosphatis]|uniref:Transglutaminase n=1 Tax=Candidatus Accumulibacter phosphatis TaxID=327160 RepID=A0A6A7RP90_9PROT|nr:transglutaminase [Candidatus Accumulibacter phosphatis]